MSLSKVRLGSLVRKQFQYKMKSYTGVFSSLVVLQLIGVLFSLGGTAMMGRGAEGINVSVQYYSADIVVVFTMIWVFISAILITTKAYKEDKFAFVTNRLSSNLSDIALLLIASILGGITAILSGYLIKVIM